MNNNFMNVFRSLMQQAGNNPQAFAINLIQKNPKFAQFLQGQNLRDLTIYGLQQNGIDPNAFLQMINRK